jgi:hypothetical protein
MLFDHALDAMMIAGMRWMDFGCTRHGNRQSNDAIRLFGGEMMDTDSLRKSKPESNPSCTSYAFDHDWAMKDGWGCMHWIDFERSVMACAVKMTRYAFLWRNDGTDSLRKSKPESLEPCTSNACEHALEAKDECSEYVE